jgi:hypothetical protein
MKANWTVCHGHNGIDCNHTFIVVSNYETENEVYNWKIDFNPKEELIKTKSDIGFWKRKNKKHETK